MTFLNKTAFAKKDLNLPKTEGEGTTTPKLGGGLKKSPLKASGLKGAATAKPGSLLKKKVEPKELDLENTAVEETKEEIKKPAATKPSLGKKTGLKKSPAKEVEVKEEVAVDEPINFEKPEQKEVIEEVVEETTPEASEEVEEVEEVVEEKAEEKVEEEPKTTSNKKKASSSKKNTSKATTKKETTKVEQTIQVPQVDETKRVSLEEMDAIMRPIVAPTTELWEQEKKDILEALNAIKVEQDMNMSQVKTCLSDLDELKFEILPRQHDAETMYDGTKQNYDTVKAVAIAKGSGSNAEARKAEGILACQNFVTPSGAVVDLHQYMLLIEERYKFYEKISEGVNFKKYSLVNYNNAIKAEKEGK